LRCTISRCWKPRCSREYDAGPPRRNWETDKSQGIVMLHSEAATEGRTGRASEALGERTTKTDAKSIILLRMQDSDVAKPAPTQKPINLGRKCDNANAGLSLRGTSRGRVDQGFAQLGDRRELPIPARPGLRSTPAFRPAGRSYLVGRTCSQDQTLRLGEASACFTRKWIRTKRWWHLPLSGTSRKSGS
jgi:hypothetical protein